MVEGSGRLPLSRVWPFLCVALLAIVVYLPAIRSEEGFVLDDVALIGENPRLSHRQGWEALLRDRYWDRRRPDERLWRPLAVATLALDAERAGREAPAFRRTNVFLHVLISLLVYLVALEVLPRRPALLAALVFACHPIHAEAVVSAANGRCELLSLGLALAAALLHLRARRGSTLQALGLFPLAGLALAAAWLSKENALIAPAWIALLELTRRRQGPPSPRRVAAFLGPYLFYGVLLAGYVACRGSVLEGQLLPRSGAWALGNTGLSERLLLAASTSLEGLLASLTPAQTAAHYPLPSLTGGDIPAGAAWLGVLVLAAPSLGALAGRDRRVRVVGAGVLGALVAQIPALNLIPIGVVRADRLLYTPSLFAALTLGAGAAVVLARHPRRRLLATLGLGILVLGFGLRAGDNARAWTRDDWIWGQTLERFPDLGRAHLELGRSYAARADVDPDAREKAHHHLRRALEVYAPRRSREAPFAAQARCALGRLVARDDFAQAWGLFEEARHIDPSSPEGWLGLAELYRLRAPTRTEEGARVRDLRLAERYARTCANQVAPYIEESWLLLGQILTQMPERGPEALEALDQAVRQGARPWRSHLARAELRAAAGQLEPAWADYRIALAFLEVGAELSDLEGKAYSEALPPACEVLRRLGRAEEARALAKRSSTNDRTPAIAPASSGSNR
jgi:protein O-mannosyl-transferase